MRQTHLYKKWLFLGWIYLFPKLFRSFLKEVKSEKPWKLESIPTTEQNRNVSERLHSLLHSFFCRSLTELFKVHSSHFLIKIVRSFMSWNSLTLSFKINSRRKRNWGSFSIYKDDSYLLMNFFANKFLERWKKANKPVSS